MTSMTIDCADCVMRLTAACEDCVVTAICGRAPDDTVVIDAAAARAVQLLGRSGLVAPLQHRRRPVCA